MGQSRCRSDFLCDDNCVSDIDAVYRVHIGDILIYLRQHVLSIVPKVVNRKPDRHRMDRVFLFCVLPPFIRSAAERQPYRMDFWLVTRPVLGAIKWICCLI